MIFRPRDGVMESWLGMAGRINEGNVKIERSDRRKLERPPRLLPRRWKAAAVAAVVRRTMDRWWNSSEYSWLTEDVDLV